VEFVCYNISFNANLEERRLKLNWAIDDSVKMRIKRNIPDICQYSLVTELFMVEGFC